MAETLRARIADGTLPPQSLVSEVQLESEFGVARGTVRKAIAALRDDGLLVTTPGMGSFVTAAEK
ncbi:winged helix-turn-helix domain-containing protein [Streptomyces tanashiensis]|uniref:winged helix-turn-helix domain-containing protein n=1 Tax=Streptomyces tanashiensis TaxID=67367 RepID=UPI003410BED3